MQTHSYADCVDHGQLKGAKGYGTVRRDGKPLRWHRVAYCEFHGLEMSEIAGKVVRHSCDNPRCINPKHLLLGTQADNVKDKMDRGRHRSPVGERCGASVLTAALVAKIRSEYLRGSSEFGTTGLAKKYGVSQSAVYKCIARNTWSHV